ncbi:MAG: hypothetical protein IT555_08085 [Acetobacteraceae bacterium]|nr:hypothetical protein [Acetobacteraceae bacterium]
MAGLEEQDEMFQLGEQARQAGQDHGLQGGGQPAGGILRCGAAQRGEPIGQRG